MPELPEVETVRRVLESWCLNKIVKKVYVYYAPIVENKLEEEFNEKLMNQRIIGMERLGKFLVFRFENFSMVSHLRMEGKWHYGHFKDNLEIKDGISFDPFDKISQESKHVHFAIEFSDGHLLMYHDVRKFGRIQLFDNDECYFNEPLIKLGYEPFNELINNEYLINKFSKLKCSVKEALLDQSIMVGLGNIYVDEVLFASGIIPSMPAKDITLEQATILIKESIRILNKAIEMGGSTIKSYHAANSVDGKFQNALLVYGRANEHCVKCNSLIFKTKLGGRGTHFCPKCQKSNLANRVVGVTGYIGSGKSTLSNLFKNDGYKLLDADFITKDAQKKDGALYSKIVKLFNKYDILDSNQELNRSLIRELIIKDSMLDSRLKKLVHEYVYNYIYEEIFRNPNQKFVLDVPLLFESHIDEICDYIICVRTNDETFKERIISRNTMPLSDAKMLRDKQIELFNENKIDCFIDNDGSIEDLKTKYIELKQCI